MNEVDKAYMERGREYDPDPAEEIFSEFKSLIVALGFIAGIVMAALAFWGKI